MADVNIQWGGWDADPPKIKYVIDEVLVRGTINLLVAKPGSLKTWIGLSMLIAKASGSPWLGRFPTYKPGKCIFIDYESGLHETLRRVSILGGAYAGKRLGYCYAKTPITEPEFWYQVVAHEPELILVDSLSHGSFGVSENSAEFALPLKYAGSVCREAGITVLFIHHARKSPQGSSTEEDARDAVRGSGAVVAACDSVYFSQNNGPSACRVVNIKQRIGRNRAPIEAMLRDGEGLKLGAPPKVIGGKYGG